MWVLTQYIGYNGDEELYVVVPHDTVETFDEAKMFNREARKYRSRLRYYEENKLTNPNRLPPAKIITEREAEAWAEFKATVGPL